MLIFDEETGKIYDLSKVDIEQYEMTPEEVQELMEAMKDNDVPIIDLGDEVKGYLKDCFTRSEGSFDLGDRTFSLSRKMYCIRGCKR